MALSRKCSEYAVCGRLLVNKTAQAKTCSPACRSRRSDRLKRAKAKGGRPADPDHVTRAQIKDAASELVKEELRPIIREALTQDILDGLGELVAMVPAAIAALKLDLASDDETVRQRAYTAVMRYTLDNKAIAPASAEQAPAPMQVVFAMPRPGDAAPPLPEAQPSEATELATCAECDTEQPRSNMVANSERCQSCHDEVQARVAAKFGGSVLP